MPCTCTILALAAAGATLYGLSGTPPPYPGMPLASPGVSDRQNLVTKLATRFHKLTGKNPWSMKVRASPNGQWTEASSEQLSLMRTAKFGKIPDLKGTAEFKIVFAPGKIESVEYVSGDESLKALEEEKIKAAHYEVEFPIGRPGPGCRRPSSAVSRFPAAWP